jgi:predicted transcriptional regulator
MSRRSILDVAEDILKLLSNKKEYPVQRISSEINSQWRTTIKVLEFLKRIGLLKETEGKTTYKAERLFSLK